MRNELIQRRAKAGNVVSLYILRKVYRLISRMFADLVMGVKGLERDSSFLLEGRPHCF
jgi:hypothetical protein